MIQLTERHFKIVQSILAKYPYHFYAFGSRASHMAKKFSDLDLCIKERVPDAVLAHIEEDFDESDLPFKIEVVLWDRCSPEFQALIGQGLVAIPTEN